MKSITGIQIEVYPELLRHCMLSYMRSNLGAGRRPTSKIEQVRGKHWFLIWLWNAIKWTFEFFCQLQNLIPYATSDMYLIKAGAPRLHDCLLCNIVKILGCWEIGPVIVGGCFLYNPLLFMFWDQVIFHPVIQSKLEM